MTGLYDDQTVRHAVEKVRHAAASGQISQAGADNVVAWLERPYYSRYVPDILELVTNDRWAELDRLFWEVIPFGTGGRRGTMERFGSATMNERTVAESADGLARYLRQHKGTAGGRAAVACDTRHRSAEFARLTATTLAAHGLTVFLFDAPRSTPELSFAVRHLRCDVGVMITASHNPPSDNGFKAYWSDGAQVLDPHDRAIIRQVESAGDIPELDYDQAVRDGRIETIGDAVDRAYVQAVAAQSLSSARTVTALYSPLHGVGESSVYRVLRQAGFDGVNLFEPHRAPDGDFPNVPDHLPNPERPEVFTPMLDQAAKLGASVLLASDPDADRLGVAVRGPQGAYVSLTGNQVAALLTDYILAKRAAADSLTTEHYVVETLVTTPLVAAIAAPFRVRVVRDLLVGFKYIARTMDQMGPERFIFGAEESLGYLAGDYCRDKDAAVAALLLLELAAELQAEGRTLLDRLDELYCQHGYYYETQHSEACPPPRGHELRQALMRRFRENPPHELGGVALSRVRDYLRHEVRALPENTPVEPLPQPESDLLFFESADPATRLAIAVRPSGTEPKIKFYLFAHAMPPRGLTPAGLQDIKDRTVETTQSLIAGLRGWIQDAIKTL